MAGKLEIEAKFEVCDQEAIPRILRQEQLDRFELRRGPTYQVEDIYQDTVEHSLYRAGYGCRIRRKGNSWTATLKEQCETHDMIHERMELNVDLPYLELDPLRWPDSEVRQLAIQLSGGAPLHRMFTIRQNRHTRVVMDQDREVAELSLDEVHLDIPGHSETCFELELERLSEGSPEDIRELSTLSLAEWPIEPQTQSKFLMAMSKKDQETEKTTASYADKGLLPGHRPVLEAIAQIGRPLYARRANLLLAWDSGANIQELRSTSGYSRSSVYHWLKAYQQEGITIFPKQILSQAEATVGSGPRETAQGLTDAGVAGGTRAWDPPALHLEELYRRYGLDMDHARQVAHLAAQLFDASRQVHGLSDSSRELLEKGGMLHNVGLNVDPARHHIAGRDILLETPVVELGDEERLMVAAMTFLHRRRITPKKLKKKTVAMVPASRRQEMLDLAALIRMADGLDYSQSQSTRIVEVNATPSIIEVVLDGPYALHDAARAEKKADLWNILHPLRFFFRCRNPASSGERVSLDENETSTGGTMRAGDSAADLPPGGAEAGSFQSRPELDVLQEWVGESPGVSAGDTMSEAGRKLFRFHLCRMLLHEPGTRQGVDIEELHDMRVATRRLRSASRLVRDFFVPKEIGPFLRGLRRTARILGAVRDLDVLMDKADKYQETLPSQSQDGLAPLLAAWHIQRETARQKMIAYLDGDSYSRFVQASTEFVTSEGAGARPVDPSHPHPHLVRHVIPRLIYSHFEAVRAYECWLDDPPLEMLHALRIDCKRLRYAMEFFREVLGQGAKIVIKEVTALQDHLGELHDADVADHLLRDFLDGGLGALHPHSTDKKRAEPRQRIMAPGVALYLAEKQTELQTLVRTFPEAWAHFNRPEVRQNLAAAIAEL